METKILYERGNNFAELDTFKVSDNYCHDEEIWSVTIIPKNDPENFIEYTFFSRILAEMFLIENEYKEVVF